MISQLEGSGWALREKVISHSLVSASPPDVFRLCRLMCFGFAA
jgi:hypothetical protein